MTKFLPLAKSLLIICLAALSVFLTTQLWLVHIPNNNFFTYVDARFTPSVPDEVTHLVRPFRIVKGSGDGFFIAQYNDIINSAYWQYGETVITNFLQNGNFITRTATDMTEILNRPVLIYQYAFYMDASIFVQAFGHRAGALVADRVANFYAVAITPPEAGINRIDIYFIGQNYTWQFVFIPDAAQANDGFFDFAIPAAHENAHRLIPATIDDNEYGYANHLWFNSYVSERFVYSPVHVTNPYQNHAGQLHLAHIRGQIAHMFSNPATINQTVSVNGIYTFSNLNTVVRYMPWDVIEYSSFRTIGHGTASFVADFSAAFAFVRDDPNVINEFYLAEYEVRGRETVFRFNYVIDNFPLRLKEPWLTGPNCENPLTHPIEVTTDHGRVIRYRRIAHNFETDRNILSRVRTWGDLAFHIPMRPQTGSRLGLTPISSDMASALQNHER